MSGSATTTASSQPDEGFTHRQILVIMSGLMMGMFLASLDQTIVSTALPTIVGDFHHSNLLSWVITAYLLASTASTPIWGKAGDLYGRKRLFQLAIVLFLVASALCGLSQNIFELIVFRGLQGIGGGGLLSLAFAIIGDVIPPRERGRYQGYFGAVFGVSSVVGPLAGGFAVDNLTWRYIFYVNLPLGIAALAVTNRVLRLPMRKREVQIDWWGAILLVAGVSCILLATQLGGSTYPWSSWQVIGLFVLGALILAGFAFREAVAPEPIIPLALFRLQIFTVSNIISFVSGVAMFGALAFLPQYLQLVHGVSATESGLLLLPLLVGLLAMSISSGIYISKTGRYRWFPLAGTIIVTTRPGAAIASRRAHLADDREPGHPGLRHRARPVHAGADARRAERRAGDGARRRDLVRHLLPVHGRRHRGILAGRGPDRGDHRRAAPLPAAGRAGRGREQGGSADREPGPAGRAEAHASGAPRGHHPGVLACD